MTTLNLKATFEKFCRANLRELFDDFTPEVAAEQKLLLDMLFFVTVGTKLPEYEHVITHAQSSFYQCSLAATRPEQKGEMRAGIPDRIGHTINWTFDRHFLAEDDTPETLRVKWLKIQVNNDQNRRESLEKERNDVSQRILQALDEIHTLEAAWQQTH